MAENETAPKTGGADGLDETLPFLDTLSPDYDRNLHAAHRAASERSWLARTPVGLAFLHYEDVLWLLRDKRWRELGADALVGAGITEGPLWTWFQDQISSKEGEDHARLRRLVSRAFTPRRVESLRPLMRATTHDLLDRFVDRGACEFVAEFAAPYPVRVISGLLGIPDEDFERFHAWSRDLSLAYGSRIAVERPRIEAALLSLNAYVDDLLAARAESPQDDLISDLVAVEEQGDRLSRDELRAMVTVLIFGAQDTTQCQLACAAHTFIQHPDQWERLAKEPEWVVSAAEEVLRYEPAGSGSPRLSTEDIEYKGLTIPAGTVALPSAPAANRDPTIYPDPDRFDMTRKHAEPMLTFGGGAHYCLGASLARIEIQEALAILSVRMPGIAADGEPEWRVGSLIRGPERLPVRFDSAPKRD
jgi:cytochrome P450